MSKKHIVMLSIDWDYFVKPMPDTGANENYGPAFIDTLWHTRYVSSKMMGVDLAQELKPWISVKEFEKWLRQNHFDLSDYKFAFSDSHGRMYNYIQQEGVVIDELYNFDSHHDLGYNAERTNRNCENWLGHAITDGMVKKVHQVYPDKGRQEADEGAAILDQVEKGIVTRYTDLKDVPGSKKVSYLVISKSGSWTPPWADDEFLHLVNSHLFKAKGVHSFDFKDFDENGYTSIKREFVADQVNTEFEMVSHLLRSKQ